MRDSIVNTYDQLMAARESGLVKRPVAIGPAYLPGRGSSRCGWVVWSPVERTDPDHDAPWYFGGKKHFGTFGKDGTRREQTAAALTDAMRWANDTYGPFNWARNRMGDYIPAQIKKAFPLRKGTE
jgi:hypothetical protein